MNTPNIHVTLPAGYAFICGSGRRKSGGWHVISRESSPFPACGVKKYSVTETAASGVCALDDICAGCLDALPEIKTNIAMAIMEIGVRDTVVRSEKWRSKPSTR